MLITNPVSDLPLVIYATVLTTCTVDVCTDTLADKAQTSDPCMCGCVIIASRSRILLGTRVADPTLDLYNHVW